MTEDKMVGWYPQFNGHESEKVKVKSLDRVHSLRPLWTIQPTMLLHPWNFLGKSTGMGCHFLLQGIFPTQGWNPGLLHCRQTLYCLSHQGSLTCEKHLLMP